jgi:3-oxoacyl-[acyl-carrier protein] reductase
LATKQIVLSSNAALRGALFFSTFLVGKEHPPIDDNWQLNKLHSNNNMQIQLQNKIALVGGSTQGLGLAIATQLAACGATVILMARNEQKLQTCLQQLPTPNNQQHQYLVADFTNFTEYQHTITNFFDKNAVDILVNNTQGPPTATALQASNLQYTQAFELLFQTVTFTTQLALQTMMQKGFGRIINVSSLTVKQPLQHLVLSNTMRSALLSWAKALAADVAKYNITVNSILTGYFNTERTAQLQATVAANKQITIEEVQKEILQQIPMQRFGTVEEYGYLATFLASEYSSYITGTAIPIDGGFIKGI